ncbi:formylglycine-generating enzyme family protein [Candidatus Uabimicrobium amorphum]|uniref:Sulfatase-modifying factor enzyme-like domain-containing protein n=1 Tax=Uabimicrobium amorphum TaxID=2596890 RepID=A0A5S9F4N8_UABAM|nr:formylglycine-generating enzyme family protein [Candidatus Uabimicrobium amorphum]BBM85471.1 hypothetical protein UABAM_03840 [Candidatus Uabimicrobium amorphum]
MEKQIVKGKSLQKIEANTIYKGCSFYLEDVINGADFNGTELDNCSFRGWFNDWGRDEYGLWMAFTFKKIRQVLRWIDPGTFTMGLSETEEHEVTLDRGFWLADTTCTQELWRAVMGKNPSYFKGKQQPVESVSWDDCISFMEKLSGEIPQLELSLPTEAQWEYACRAGTTTAFSFGESVAEEQVNYDGYRPVKVKSLPCNSWGLYEMHGNVSEWCRDIYNEYTGDSITDDTEPIVYIERALRGGSWYDDSLEDLRSGVRYGEAPFDCFDFVGFRFCLNPQ